MSVVMSSISRSTVDCNSTMFDHKGLRQVQNYIVPEEDLRGRNMLDITTDIESHSHEPLPHCGL